MDSVNSKVEAPNAVDPVYLGPLEVVVLSDLAVDAVRAARDRVTAVRRVSVNATDPSLVELEVIFYSTPSEMYRVTVDRRSLSGKVEAFPRSFFAEPVSIFFRKGVDGKKIDIFAASTDLAANVDSKP
jgi:hypothetical protein